MKIISHEERTYIYDEIEIEGWYDEIIHFRRNRIESKFRWEYFDKFEQAWLSVDIQERYDELEDLFSNYEYLTMLNLGLPNHLKI